MWKPCERTERAAKSSKKLFCAESKRRSKTAEGLQGTVLASRGRRDSYGSRIADDEAFHRVESRDDSAKLSSCNRSLVPDM